MDTIGYWLCYRNKSGGPRLMWPSRFRHLCMLRQTVKVEVYVREVIQVISNVLILTNKKPRQMCIWWGMQVRKFKIWMNKWSCYFEVMSRNVRDSPELCSPDRTACNHNRSFTQKREWWDSVFLVSLQRNTKNTIKGHPWLLFLIWKDRIFCYYSSGYPLAQHSIPLFSGGTTLVTPFWSGTCLTREEILMRVVII